MKPEMIEWIKENAPKQLRSMSIYGAATAITGIIAAASIPRQLGPIIPPNCKSIEISTKGTDISIKASDCSSQNVSIEQQEVLTTNNLTEIDLKLENLYDPGEYQIDQQHLSELKQKDPVFRFLAKQGYTLYLQGSADRAGEDKFTKSLTTNFCGAEDFNRIKLHSSVDDVFEKQISSYKVQNPATNSDLPQLRAREMQCMLKSEYPAMKTEILEGGVVPAIGSQYRRVKFFISKKNAN